MGLTMREKQALIRETAQLYQKASKKHKSAILDQFVQITGYHRKYATQILANWGKTHTCTINGKQITIIAGLQRKRKKRAGKQLYDAVFCASLQRIWKFFDYMCGKRLVYIIRSNMVELETYEPFMITPDIKNKLLTVSAATIDRKLKDERLQRALKLRYSGKKAGFLKYRIPVRTSFTFEERLPGFFELDTVFHSGGSACGEFIRTLTITDVCLGWTMLIPLRNSAYRWIQNALKTLQQTLPYELHGIDTDNGSEFINKPVFEWCRNNNISFTRSRSYHKNDNCFVEQKNDYAVRRFVGYCRYDSDEEYVALKQVYGPLTLLLNYFYPAQKIINKTKIGAKVYKTYEACKTPYERLMESSLIPQAAKDKATQQRKELSLIKLKQELDVAIARLLFIHRRKLSCSKYTDKVAMT